MGLELRHITLRQLFSNGIRISVCSERGVDLGKALVGPDVGQSHGHVGTDAAGVVHHRACGVLGSDNVALGRWDSGQVSPWLDSIPMGVVRASVDSRAGCSDNISNSNTALANTHSNDRISGLYRYWHADCGIVDLERERLLVRQATSHRVAR